MKKTKSSGGIVLNSKNQILVVSQKGLSWSLPKGKIEEETELEAAKREIYEESGIKDLKFIKKLGSYQRYRVGLNNKDDESNLKTITIFLFKTNQQKLSPKDPRNPKAIWIDKEKVANLLTHRKDKEFFLKVKDKL